MRLLVLVACLVLTAPAMAHNPNAEDPLQAAAKAAEAGDHARAAELLRPLAETGDSEAQYRLGMALAQGREYGAAGADALVWLERSALQNHEAAILRVAYAYQNWPNSPPDRAALVRWIEHGVEAGFPWAMSWLAGYLADESGLYTPRNLERARELRQRSAEAGNGHAMVPLALMLIAGEGGPADVRFTEWPTGELYHYGAPGIEPDLQLAAHWYMRATRQGHQPHSLWDRLADLYETLGDRARAAAALEIFEANLHDPHRQELVHMRERLRARINAYHESLSETEEAERYRVVLACRFNDGVCD